MAQVIDLAKDALVEGELPIAAILFSGDEVLAKAFARDKGLKQRLVHAELLALLELDRLKPFPANRREVYLYTNLEPCMMCLGACLVSDVSKVFYSLESPTDGASKMYLSSDIEPTEHVGCRQTEVTGGLLREESRVLFIEFCERFPKGGYSEWARTLI